MSQNGHNEQGTLAAARALLDAGQPQKALETINRCKSNSLALRNARGVCLLRMGEAEKALDHYRALVLIGGGVDMREGLPTAVKTNYATALLLTKNAQGCVDVLDEIHNERDPGVVKLRGALKGWQATLNPLLRVLFKLRLLMPETSVSLGFPPGELWFNGAEREHVGVDA